MNENRDILHEKALKYLTEDEIARRKNLGEWRKSREVPGKHGTRMRRLTDDREHTYIRSSERVA